MTKEFAVEKNTKAPEGALAAGTTGFVIGGALGWLAGIGTLAIPGIGPLVAAGPIVAALAGAGAGGAIGGITGALIGLGVPELEAKRYEAAIRRKAGFLCPCIARTCARLRTPAEFWRIRARKRSSCRANVRQPRLGQVREKQCRLILHHAVEV